jgi:hypothetical protein
MMQSGEDKEQSLMLSSVMRIMTLIICRMPFDTMSAETVVSIITIALK